MNSQLKRLALFVCLIVTILSVAGLASRTEHKTFGAGALRQADVAASGPETWPVSRSGRIASLRGYVLEVEDGEGRHTFRLTSETRLSRGSGYRMVTDGDLQRIQASDSLVVAGLRQANGGVIATMITANGFIGRDGVIARREEGFVDVHLRSSRVSADFEEGATRFLIAPDALVGRPRKAGIPNSGVASVEDLIPGTHVALQGFIADDGSYVATLLWLPTLSAR